MNESTNQPTGSERMIFVGSVVCCVCVCVVFFWLAAASNRIRTGARRSTMVANGKIAVQDRDHQNNNDHDDNGGDYHQ